MEKLFTYGTLQIPEVQQRVFGRVVSGTPDTLEGYFKTDITLHDGTFPIIVERAESSVDGQVIEVTPDELVLIDRYETSAYRRIQVTLKTGDSAWVYCE
jgi:gamma-glutamylcyclotransferase (GGCT)/AIG2-like uncharacterized protein YtfP